MTASKDQPGPYVGATTVADEPVASTHHLGRTRSGGLVAAICCLIVVFDGYDVAVFGATLPSILKYPEWQATPGALGLIGSVTLVGMLVGSLVCGFVTDRIGRKRVLIGSVTWFSLCMIVCAAAPNLETFGLFRLLAGIGLGGVLPTVNALAIEFAPPGRRYLFSAVVNIGFPLGTMLSAVVGIFVIEDFGFRFMYGIAVLPLLLVLVAWFVLPESADFLGAKGRLREAAEVRERFGLSPTPDQAAHDTAAGDSPQWRFGSLFRPPLLTKLLLFGFCGICVQLIIYGLTTWLPQLMQQAGYPPTGALTFLATLGLGAVVGSLIMGRLADRIGVRTMTTIAFGIGAVGLATLSLEPPMIVVYVAVALCGTGANGTAIMIYGYVATWFPTVLRGSALGSFIAMGRIGGISAPLIGGWIIAAGFAARINFVSLLVPAALGVIVSATLLPRMSQRDHAETRSA